MGICEDVHTDKLFLNFEIIDNNYDNNYYENKLIFVNSSKIVSFFQQIKVE